MLGLLFGIAWCLFTTLFCIVGFFFPANPNARIPVPVIIIVLSLSNSIGVFLICRGAKAIITERKTDKYGKILYGRINNVTLMQHRYSKDDEIPTYQVEILAYNHEDNRTQEFKKIIGFNRDKYPIGSYVLLKHYKNNTIITDLIDKSNVPLHALKAFAEYELNSSSTSVLDSNKTEIV